MNLLSFFVQFSQNWHSRVTLYEVESSHKLRDVVSEVGVVSATDDTSD
jgi:hypothetical protein